MKDYLQDEFLIRTLFMLVPRIPPSSANMTENMTVKKLQSSASQSSAPSNTTRLPSSFEVPDYPLEHFSRCLNIAGRQMIVNNHTHILPFELTFSIQYPQEISRNKWRFKVQDHLNWIRDALSANGEPDYSFIMIKRREKQTRCIGYAYMKMNARTYLNTVPCKNKTYSVPPLKPNTNLTRYGKEKNKMAENQTTCSGEKNEDLVKHKQVLILRNPHLVKQEIGLSIVGKNLGPRLACNIVPVFDTAILFNTDTYMSAAPCNLGL